MVLNVNSSKTYMLNGRISVLLAQSKVYCASFETLCGKKSRKFRLMGFRYLKIVNITIAVKSCFKDILHDKTGCDPLSYEHGGYIDRKSKITLWEFA